MADAQWKQVEAQRIGMALANAGANLQAQQQNQQWLNAYNTRTTMLAYPQTVNVEHSGTIYLHEY